MKLISKKRLSRLSALLATWWLQAGVAVAANRGTLPSQTSDIDVSDGDWLGGLWTVIVLIVGVVGVALILFQLINVASSVMKAYHEWSTGKGSLADLGAKFAVGLGMLLLIIAISYGMYAITG